MVRILLRFAPLVWLALASVSSLNRQPDHEKYRPRKSTTHLRGHANRVRASGKRNLRSAGAAYHEAHKVQQQHPNSIETKPVEDETFFGTGVLVEAIGIPGLTDTKEAKNAPDDAPPILCRILRVEQAQESHSLPSHVNSSMPRTFTHRDPRGKIHLGIKREQIRKPLHFKADDDWKEIPPHALVDPGLEYKFDVEHHKRYARSLHNADGSVVGHQQQGWHRATATEEKTRHGNADLISKNGGSTVFQGRGTVSGDDSSSATLSDGEFQMKEL